jgi:rfaE bifunctional protein kinase chain/domain
MAGTNKTEELFKSFERTKVLIIGDVMLDAYIWGQVERISPEAPVPIVTVEKRENRLGGAANVALNIKALGATPVLCSVIGTDERSRDFQQLLENAGLPKDGILTSDSRKTTTKFRVIGNNVQLLRVDDEINDELSGHDTEYLKNTISDIIEKEDISIILFQDYDKGVITKELIRFVVDLAKKHRIPVAVDPKKNNFLEYKDVTLFKPNLKELQEGLNVGIDPSDIRSIEAAIEQLQEKLEADIVMNTLSEGGVLTRWKKDGKYLTSHHRAHVRNIADVSGAGDTVISVAALCLAQGLGPSEITAVANLAGGLVCEEVGVVPVSKERLKEEIFKSNILK